MYKVHARVSQGASGLHAVERVVEVMYTLQRCDGVNQSPNSQMPKREKRWMRWSMNHLCHNYTIQGGEG